MKEAKKPRGRKKKKLDLSLLIDADQIREPEANPFFITCSICGSTRNVTMFKNKHICEKCLTFIKDRNLNS